MKKQRYYLFVLPLSVLMLFSCSKKQYAGFTNSYPDHFYNQTVEDESLDKPEAPLQTEASASANPALNVKTEKFVNLEETPKETKQKAKKTTNKDLLKVLKEAKEIHKKDFSKKEKSDLKKKKSEIKEALKSQEDRTFFLTVLLVLIAIILPPVAVLLVDGLRGPFWLSLLLTLLFYFPGLIYALWRIFKAR